jgi:hypothetical protein
MPRQAVKQIGLQALKKVAGELVSQAELQWTISKELLKNPQKSCGRISFKYLPCLAWCAGPLDLNTSEGRTFCTSLLLAPSHPGRLGVLLSRLGRRSGERQKERPPPLFLKTALTRGRERFNSKSEKEFCIFHGTRHSHYQMEIVILSALGPFPKSEQKSHRMYWIHSKEANLKGKVGENTQISFQLYLVSEFVQCSDCPG